MNQVCKCSYRETSANRRPPARPCCRLHLQHPRAPRFSFRGRSPPPPAPPARRPPVRQHRPPAAHLRCPGGRERPCGARLRPARPPPPPRSRAPRGRTARPGPARPGPASPGRGGRQPIGAALPARGIPRPASPRRGQPALVPGHDPAPVPAGPARRLPLKAPAPFRPLPVAFVLRFLAAETAASSRRPAGVMGCIGSRTVGKASAGTVLGDARGAAAPAPPHDGAGAVGRGPPLVPPPPRRRSAPLAARHRSPPHPARSRRGERQRRVGAGRSRGHLRCRRCGSARCLREGAGRASRGGSGRTAAAPCFARRRFIVARAYITLRDLHVCSPPSLLHRFRGERRAKRNPFLLAEPFRGDAVGEIAYFHWATHFSERIPSLWAMQT